MNRRRGWTLIELMIAVTAGTAMLALAVATLHVLIRLDGTARAELQVHQAQSQLARQFREDCHAARRITPLSPPADQAGQRGWEFDLGRDHTLEYRIADDALLRTERIDGELRKQEAFTLTPSADVSMDMEPQKQGAMVALRLVPAVGNRGEIVGLGPVRIEAVLAKERVDDVRK